MLLLFQNFSSEVSFLSAALQEERFKTERLEEQINDLTELHQNEVLLSKWICKALSIYKIDILLIHWLTE